MILRPCAILKRVFWPIIRSNWTFLLRTLFKKSIGTNTVRLKRTQLELWGRPNRSNLLKRWNWGSGWARMSMRPLRKMAMSTETMISTTSNRSTSMRTMATWTMEQANSSRTTRKCSRIWHMKNLTSQIPKKRRILRRQSKTTSCRVMSLLMS